MFPAFNAMLRNATMTQDTDPRYIPAKLHLEGLGTIDYSVYHQDLIGGATHRVEANDPTRTWHFRRTGKVSSTPVGRGPVLPDGLPKADPVPKGLYGMMAAMAGMCVGFGIMLGGAAALNPWVVIGGAITFALSTAALIGIGQLMDTHSNELTRRR